MGLKVTNVFATLCKQIEAFLFFIHCFWEALRLHDHHIIVSCNRDKGRCFQLSCSFKTRLVGYAGALLFLFFPMTSPTPIHHPLLLSDRRLAEPLQTRVHLQFFWLPPTLSNLAVSWTRSLYSLVSRAWNAAQLFSRWHCAGFGLFWF